MLFLYDQLLVSSFHTNHTFCRPNSTCCVKNAVAELLGGGRGRGRVRMAPPPPPPLPCCPKLSQVCTPPPPPAGSATVYHSGQNKAQCQNMNSQWYK